MRNLNLPNLLTLLRVVLTPFVVQAILDRRFGRALVILLIAGITDVLDGLAARGLHLQSRFGAYLDPIADKALLTTGYLALGLAHAVPWWLVGLIFGRDLLILLLAAVALLFTSYREFPPSIWGKLSTFCQIGAAVMVLTAGAFPTLGMPTDPFLWIAALATAWSGADYFARAIGKLRTRHDSSAQSH